MTQYLPKDHLSVFLTIYVILDLAQLSSLHLLFSFDSPLESLCTVLLIQSPIPKFLSSIRHPLDANTYLPTFLSHADP